MTTIYLLLYIAGYFFSLVEVFKESEGVAGFSEFTGILGLAGVVGAAGRGGMAGLVSLKRKMSQKLCNERR